MVFVILVLSLLFSGKAHLHLAILGTWEAGNATTSMEESSSCDQLY